jgi:DNA invertase Pin-like site-specific DNA recombinase
MLVGYARVSTLEQTLALQQDALTQAGCERLFTDTASGSRTDRTGLDEALRFLRDGQDTLVVWRLDRLGRNLRHLIARSARCRNGGLASGRCRSRSTPPPAVASSSSTSSAHWPSSNAT